MSTIIANRWETISGVGAGVIYVDTIADLQALDTSALVDGQQVSVKEYHAGTSVGGGEFYWDAASTDGGDGGTVFDVPGTDTGRWKRIHLDDLIHVTWFGAVGDDEQTLYPTSYTVDGVTITQQTADALAFNKAITCLRSIGGGALHIPKGTYRIYGYLETIDFPVLIVGDGPDVTVVKNCVASPTNTNGYGVFFVNPVNATRAVNVSFRDLTVDGDADNRTEPTGELRLYPIGPYGEVFLSMSNVHLRNSPIDCMRTSFKNNRADVGLVAVNCVLSNSFRNTLSCVSGWNQKWVNCVFEKAGKVHGGTKPRYCLDIEPTSAAKPIRNLTYTGCTFQDAENVIIAGTWGEAKFVGCTINAYGDSAARDAYPWMAVHGQGHYDYIGCNFYSDNGMKFIVSSGEAPSAGYFADTQYLRLSGCMVEGGGLNAVGPRTIVEDTTFKNSGHTIRINRSAASAEPHSLVLKNVSLINVFNYASDGDNASFNTFKGSYGPIYVNGLRIIFDPTQLNDVMAAMLAESPMTSAFGIYLRSNNWPATRSFVFQNIYVEGFYQKLPDYLGVAPNATNFRDWRVPSPAPADSAGQTITPGTAFYRNCLMYGSNA